MGFLISSGLILIFIGAAIACKHLPTKVQLALIIILSITLGWLHWSIAKSQLATIGFAARNRTPNQLAQDVGYALAIVGIFNTGMTFKSVRISTILLGLLFALLPIMYFLSW